MSKKMQITLISGANSDGCVVRIIENDTIIDEEEFRYGWNASYSRSWAWIAQRDHEVAIKNGSPYVRPLQPYIGDILKNKMQEFEVSSDNIELVAGLNVFGGNNVRETALTRFWNTHIKGEII